MIVITLAFCLFIYLLYLQTPSLIMSGAPKSRGMFQYVFKHFWDSFKVGKRQKVGNLMGKVIQWMKCVGCWELCVSVRIRMVTVTMSCQPSLSSVRGDPRDGTTQQTSPSKMRRLDQPRHGEASMLSFQPSGSHGSDTGTVVNIYLQITYLISYN